MPRKQNLWADSSCATCQVDGAVLLERFRTLEAVRSSGSSRNSAGRYGGFDVVFFAVGQDLGAIVIESAEAFGSRINGLDAAVEVFAH